MQVTLASAIEKLNQLREQKFIELFQHGTMSIELYKPEKVDLQTPHIQDEIYIIAKGQGTFICGEEKVEFQVHDVLFVPAGLPHKFVNFSEDFTTWVIFYGAKGGEGEKKDVK